MRLENDNPEWAKADWRSCWYKSSCKHPYEFSKRCGVVIDGEYIEPQTGQDKITFECSCSEKESQDIVWGFVVSGHRETLPTPTPTLAESLPRVQRVVGPRVKVVMQRQNVRVTLSQIRGPHIRVETLLSDSFPGGSAPEQQKEQQEVTFLRPLELSDRNENDPRSSSSAFGQSSRSFKRARLTPPNDDFHDISDKMEPFLSDQNNAFEVPPLEHWFGFEEENDGIYPSVLGQSNPLSICTTCTN
jgi:hypothetical protein